MDQPTQFDTEGNAKVFALLHTPVNENVLAATLSIARDSESIQRLEEITRQIDQPYLSSYFTG